MYSVFVFCPQVTSGLVSKPVALTNTTPNKRYVNGKKVEEHYAIIMTKVVPTKEKLASLPKLQQQFYDLLCFANLTRCLGLLLAL